MEKQVSINEGIMCLLTCLCRQERVENDGRILQVCSNNWRIIEMEVARQQIFGSESCDGVCVFVTSSDLGRILALLSPNNGRSFVFLCTSGWKRAVLVACVRSCVRGRFVRPASADSCLKLACRRSKICCLYLWNGHGFCFPSNNVIPCCSPTLYSFKSLQLLIDTVLSVMHAQNSCVFAERGFVERQFSVTPVCSVL